MYKRQLSDSRTLKEALERDKCIHEYFEWEGMYHVFHIDVNMPETISAFKQIANFLEKYSSSIFVKLDKVKYEIIRVKIKTLKTLNLEKYNTLKSNYFFGSAFVTNP